MLLQDRNGQSLDSKPRPDRATITGGENVTLKVIDSNKVHILNNKKILMLIYIHLNVQEVVVHLQSQGLSISSRIFSKVDQNHVNNVKHDE